MASLAGSAAPLAGLAKEIVLDCNRGESEQYSLSNYDEARINRLVESTFSRPIEVPASPGMVRITFIVGGGKQTRGKYDEGCQKYLIAALRKLSFEDDQGAVTMPDSAGKYKTQHDTNVNLKFVHVYPFVVVEGGDDSGGKGDGTEDTLSKQFICMASERATFERMVAAEVTFWRQKRTLLDHLQTYMERSKKIEEKLMTREELDAAEQQLYEIFDGPGVADKIEWLQKEMQSQVKAGRVTEEERTFLLSQVQANMTKVEGVLAAKEASGAPEKTLLTFKKKLENLNHRQELLASVSPIVMPFRGWEDLCALAAQMLPHTIHVNEGKTIKSNEQAEMDDIERQRHVVIENARLWFETDESLYARAEVVETNYLKKKGKKAAKSSKKPAAAKSDGWSTVGRRR
jgi:hypothetical protein